MKATEPETSIWSPRPVCTSTGQTEAVKDNHNPDFQTKFYVDQYSEIGQQMEFRLYDVDDFKTCALEEKNLCGHAHVVLSALLAVRGHEVEYPLKTHTGEY